MTYFAASYFAPSYFASSVIIISGPYRIMASQVFVGGGIAGQTAPE